jgi:hypothetical protein
MSPARQHSAWQLQFELLSSKVQNLFTDMPTNRTKERPEKILVAMHRLSKGTTKMLQYEDIVVEAFKMFPDEFALRGHPEYPDSSDVHKPLYGVLKRRGLVRAAHKTFALTTKGVETAERLAAHAGASLDDLRSPDRMTRPVRAEVDRMLASDALRFLSNNAPERILDTDFYNFIGCTVRTPPNDFLGRVTTTSDAVAAAARLGQPSKEAAEQLAATWKFLQQQFKPQIDRRREKK